MSAIPHGTPSGYTSHGCRCERCTLAARRYNTRRKLLIATGRWPHPIDGDTVRQHIAELRSAGLGTARIAELAGVGTSTISAILYGSPTKGIPPNRRVTHQVAAAILAVRADLDTIADHALIDATGTRRRVQALVRVGWSLTEQARRLGVTVQSHALINKRTQVTAGLARTIRRLYDQMSMAVPPETAGTAQARRLGERRGWPPPLAWDDATIDDPAALPNLGKKGSSTLALLENSDELIAQGYTTEQAAARLGVKRDYLNKARTRGKRMSEVAA